MKNLPPEICVIEAPCKINLHLKIGEKRPDGFHALESLFASLGLHDTLCFEKAEGEGESRLTTNWEIPGEIIKNNLVLKAVSLFREETGFKTSLKVRLDKRIPPGSGLGGGSSDAASSLLALNLLSGSPLPEEKLEKMAAFLGSDVPFFLSGGAAHVTGRGEAVKKVKPLENLWVVLVKPPFSSNTAGAFRLFDQAGEGNGAVFRGNAPSRELSGEELTRALDGNPETWPFYNDFLSIFDDSIHSIINSLKEKGASFAGLSGSGTCCFGVFKAKETAEKAAKELSCPGTFVKLSFFLAHRVNPVVQLRS